MKDYSDILNLDRPKSKYPKMPLEKRASIFMPFAALDGFRESVIDSEKTYIKRPILSVDQISDIDSLLKEIISNKLSAKYYYFIPEINDDLGNVYEFIKTIKKIECGYIYFTDKTSLELKNIINIDILS